MMHHLSNSLKFYKILLWMAINCNASLEENALFERGWIFR
ncbi:hypothetical protein SAMN04487975_101277 [Planococcus glaciei]|nr:hypothetical protein SAMN04487975_101277 [Planococcus glaciei]